MSRIAYVNGAFRPMGSPLIHVEDRGYQFADAVYEVWGVRDGALLDAQAHFDRLTRSLKELSIAEPMSRGALYIVLRELLRRNRVRDGLAYLQISRGVAMRDHAFPTPSPSPCVVMTARSLDPKLLNMRAVRGVSVVTTPDIRWKRCDIKTVGLLPNVLAKQGAVSNGAAEAWFVDGAGIVTEGASTNAWIVDEEGVLRTAPLSNAILHGVTRKSIVALASTLQMRLEERAFTLEEALRAREAFITSATNIATPVIAIDGRMVGDGRPGPIAQRLRDAYFSASVAKS